MSPEVDGTPQFDGPQETLVENTDPTHTADDFTEAEDAFMSALFAAAGEYGVANAEPYDVEAGLARFQAWLAKNTIVSPDTPKDTTE